MVRNNAKCIASLQREFNALEGCLKLTKQRREKGLRRLEDLRDENERLKQQVAQVKAREELALKLALLRILVEAKETEKELALNRRQIDNVVDIATNVDERMGNGVDGCPCSPIERQPSSRSLRPTTLISLLNRASDSSSKQEEDEDDSGFFLVETRSVYEGFAFRDDPSSSADVKEINSLTESTDSAEGSEPLKRYFCQIDENGNSSFSVLSEEVGGKDDVSVSRCGEHDNSSFAGSDDSSLYFENRCRPSILHLIQNTTTHIRAPRHRKQKLDYV